MPGILPPITELEVTNPEDLVNAVRSAIFEPCLLARTSMKSRLARVVCPEVTLDFASLGSSFLFTGVTSKDLYTLIFVLDCPIQGKAFNFGVEHHDGYMALFAPSGIVDALTPMGYSNATLSLSADVFHREVEHLLPEIPDRVVRNGLAFRVGMVAQQYLRSLLMEVRAAMSDPARPLAGLPARVALERRLIDTFLGALHDGISGDGPRLRSRAAQPERRLRQAREFLEASVDRLFHLDELCRELGMSRRGIEVMFRKSLGTTPGRYLHCQRLNAVRRSLVRADPDSTMVKEVAHGWGFLHMGHFGQNYRALFGETPRATLERTRDSR